MVAKSHSVKSRLVGFGVEKGPGTRWLHAQVDVPTTGTMQSEFRTLGAKVELKITR